MTRQARQLDRWMQQGVQLHQRGQLAEAEGLYQKVLRKEKRHPDANHLLGLVSFARGNQALARTLIKKAIAQRERDPEFHYNLGNVEKASGLLDQAAASFRTSIRYRPTDYRPWANLGNLLLDRGLADEACECFRRAITLNDRDVISYANLGHALIQQKAWQESLEVLQTAHRLAPRDPTILLHLALVNCSLDDYLQAERYNQQAQSLAPDLLKCKVLNGYFKMVAGRTQEAIETLAPLANPATAGYDEAHEYLAQLAFFRGDLVTGYQHYQRRYCARHTGLPRLAQRPATGDKLAVFREQGIGDEIRYARFLTLLEQDAVDCWVTCDARLQPLLQRSFPHLSVLPHTPENVTTLASQASHETSIASLGLFYAEQLANAAKPAGGYLKPDPQQVVNWQARLRETSGLEDDARPIIGLAWRGVKAMPEREGWYPPLEQLATQLATLDARVICLQAGLTDAEREQLTAAQLDWQAFDELDLRDDQEGLAALLACLDLAICPASAIYELAGAVGTPVWLAARQDYKLWNLSQPYLSFFYPGINVTLKTDQERWKDSLGRLVDSVAASLRSM